MPENTEWTFVADVAKWITLWLKDRRNIPFSEAKVEQKTTGSAKRRDLSLLDRDRNIALTGEVRFPDAKDGETPYNGRLVTDARRKARRAGSRFFFTWNVNRLVLWLTDSDHEVKVFDIVRIRRREELEYAAVERRIREEFIPGFLEEYAAIYAGEEETGILALDQRFISRLESVLQSIANVVFSDALDLYKSNQSFQRQLVDWMRAQEWLLSDDEQLLRDNIDRSTRLACYITANKLVFYQALRRNRSLKLPKLEVPSHIVRAERLSDHFRLLFAQAEAVTLDYQTIFDGGFIDRVPFITDFAVGRWRALVKLLNKFDFRQFGQDVIGHIFEELLSPEERHRWGQHYTHPAIVDVINAFCIRDGNAVALDPSSGSGTFLVRAYNRKKYLKPSLTHAEILAQLYACEISEYAAHLTALNLATRDLIDGENFPRVARADFFDSVPELPFCSIPDTSQSVGTGSKIDIKLTQVDAVIGNPPYLEQTKIPKENKTRYYDLVKNEWPILKLSGRSDLHVYFWPHASKLLSDEGFFGFITSSSWLDTDYGFHLQRFILQHFKLVAVLESVGDLWFTDARVATSVTVLRRCADPTKRANNLVRFVQLRKPIKILLENDGTEIGRQEASERLRDIIESTQRDIRGPDYRIVVVQQQKLWEDGCRLRSAVDGDKDTGSNLPHDVDEYKGSKWGVYLRAPDLYFDIMEKYGSKFVPLAEIAEVRYGFKSGCDDFFTPKDITEDALEEEKDPTEFRRRFRCSQRKVIGKKVRIIKAGDGSEHPIEREYLKPEIHSLMTIAGVHISQEQIQRVVLLVDKPMPSLKGTYIEAYLQYGQRESFDGETSVAERETCASRPCWYDITNYPKGTIVMPKIMQYRHIIAWNSEKLPVNNALMVVECKKSKYNKALAAVLNSTLVAFIKPYFSRKLGNEANTQLDVYAANMLPVLDIFRTTSAIQKLAAAFDAFGDRPILPLVEQRFLDAKNVSDLDDLDINQRELPIELQKEDRQALDQEVLTALGIPSDELEGLCDRLYKEVTRFGNEARVIELHAVENRKRAKKGRVASPSKVAQEIFATLDPVLIRRFPSDFLPENEDLDTVELPDGKTRLYDKDDFYDPNALVVGKKKIDLRHRPQAELAKLHVDLQRNGFVRLPVSVEACERMSQEWTKYHAEIQKIFQDLASERTEDKDRQEAIVNQLNRLLLYSTQ